MNANQIFAASALISAIADFLILVGVAWWHYPTINRSRALKAIYPISWAIFALFAYGYWHILAEPDNAQQISRDIFRPLVVIFLNTLLVVAILATLHGVKIEAQAAELAESAQKAMQSEAQRLAAEKRWLDERQEYLVIIGHELRTPINLITGYLDLLAGILPSIPTGPDGDAETLAHLRQFTEGAISGAARLRIMLRMFNATSDKPRLVPLHLCDVVYRAINDPDLYTATRRSPADVPITVDCAPVYATADADMLGTAVFELVRNSLKATRNGYIKIEVSCSGETAVVAVEDNGRGILSGDVRRIWEAGYQSQEDHRTRQNEGAGYGLAVVLHIARLHGGDAALEWTEPEVGSRFAIYLPAG